MVPVPEGQLIVCCPYCQLRSFVRGSRGLLRYQAPARVDREQAAQNLRKFLRTSWAIAPAAARQAVLNEAFLAYLPFWTVWGRVAAWVFGEERKGSGNNKRYVPREVRVVQDMSWNGAACDVGEFGVGQVRLADRELQPFNPDVLHQAGMVFEPVGAFVQAREAAESDFEKHVRLKAGLDRLSQVFVRTLRRRYALVYHPLWVLRYLFRGRAFQVVVDGISGDILYARAPGNTLYRAATLVFGMALGAFLAIDGPVFVVYNSNDDDILMLALALLVVGFGIMFYAYRTFRHGEQYEYRYGGMNLVTGSVDVKSVIETINANWNIEKWIDRLN